MSDEKTEYQYWWDTYKDQREYQEAFELECVVEVLEVCPHNIEAQKRSAVLIYNEKLEDPHYRSLVPSCCILENIIYRIEKIHDLNIEKSHIEIPKL